MQIGTKKVSHFCSPTQLYSIPLKVAFFPCSDRTVTKFCFCLFGCFFNVKKNIAYQEEQQAFLKV